MQSYASNGLRRAAIIGAVTLAMAAPLNGQRVAPKGGLYMNDNGTQCTVSYKDKEAHIKCESKNQREGSFEAYFVGGRFVGFRKSRIDSSEKTYDKRIYETLVTELMPDLKALADDMKEGYQIVPVDDERIKQESVRAGKMLDTINPENCVVGDCKI